MTATPTGPAGTATIMRIPRSEAMRSSARRNFIPTNGGPKRKIVGLYALLLAANFGAWAWAFSAFHAYPILLGTAALAYSFGLRHAFDADHIAAIDNVTRKLMQQGQRPVGVGLYFSLGHSTIVVGLTIAIALTATALQDRFAAFKTFGAVAGTLVSALFLFAIAAANVVVLVVGMAQLFGGSSRRTFRRGGSRPRAGRPRPVGAVVPRPVPRSSGKSWQMYPIGLLFGLGFDTATEVGLLGSFGDPGGAGPVDLVDPGLSGAVHRRHDAARHHRQRGDARRLRLGLRQADPQALLQPHHHRRLGGSGGDRRRTGDAEPDRRPFRPDRGEGFWGAVGALNDNFGALGYVVVGVFVFAWLVSAIVYRLKRYDEIETVAP